MMQKNKIMKGFSNIKYAENTAGEMQVRIHLEKCDTNFVPRLSKKANIAEYAKKINTNAITFEAWQNDELIGVVAAYFNDKENKRGFITNVSTIKQYEGMGIGSRLIKMCIEYAKANNYRSILLEVNKENNTAIQLYNKYGFVKTGETGGLMQMKLDLYL